MVWVHIIYDHCASRSFPNHRRRPDDSGLCRSKAEGLPKVVAEAEQLTHNIVRSWRTFFRIQGRELS